MGMIGCGDVSHTCGLVMLLAKDGHRYDAILLLVTDLGEGLMLPAYLITTIIILSFLILSDKC